MTTFDLSPLALANTDDMDYYTLSTINGELTYYFNFCDVTNASPPECSQQESVYCSKFNRTGVVNVDTPKCISNISKSASSPAVAYQYESSDLIDGCFKLSSDQDPSGQFQAPYATYTLIDINDPGKCIIFLIFISDDT